MAKIKSKSMACAANGTLIHCKWECKTQALWKTSSFLQRKYTLPTIHFTSQYLSKRNESIFPYKHIHRMVVIAQNWNNPNVHQQVNE